MPELTQLPSPGPPAPPPGLDFPPPLNFLCPPQFGGMRRGDGRLDAVPYTCCMGPYISLMHHPGGGQDFSSLEGGLLWDPPIPCAALLPPPSLLGQLLRDLPPTLPSPKDAPGPCGAPPAPPSATTTQNSSAPTSALVFNGPFFPGAEGGSPSPALHPYYFFFPCLYFPGVRWWHRTPPCCQGAGCAP